MAALDVLEFGPGPKRKGGLSFGLGFGDLGFSYILGLALRVDGLGLVGFGVRVCPVLDCVGCGMQCRQQTLSFRSLFPCWILASYSLRTSVQLRSISESEGTNRHSRFERVILPG